MELVIVRHTSVNLERDYCYGNSDVALSPTFRDEARYVKQQLNHIYSADKPDAVFTSPLSRCTQLADYCGYCHAKRDLRIKELDFGQWEMKRWDEIDYLLSDQYYDDWKCVTAPEGESFMQHYERVSAFLNEMISKNVARVLVFSHAGVIACARAYYGLCTLDEIFAHPIPYGALATFK